MTKVDNNSNLSSSSKLPEFRSKNFLILALVTIVVAVVIALAFKINNQNQLNTTANVGALRTPEYKQFENFVLSGTNEEVKIEFEKPQQLQALKNQQPTTGFARLIHEGSQQDSGGSKITAQIEEYRENAPTATELNDFGVALTNNKDSAHTAAIDPIKQYLNTEFNGYDLNLSIAVALPTEKIKKNIWQIEFSAKADGVKDAGNDISGRLILIAGEHAYYYYTVSAIGPVWESNSEAWNHIINSISIE